MGWIPKISVACISCMSCQQTRPISLSRQHRISTKLGMQHHIYLLSSLIISFYILTKFLLCYMFSKGHVMLTWLFFRTLHIEPQIFFAKKPLEFLFQHKKPFQRWNYWTCYEYQVVYNSQQCWYVQKNWVLLIFAFHILQLKVSRNFHYVFFGRWFCLCVIFKTWCLLPTEHCKMKVFPSISP